jgi:hypothetical protein
MKKHENVQLNPNWLNITPIEFERILNLYGMQHKTYSELRGKSNAWFYTVLRKKKYLSFVDIKILADEISAETFDFLLDKVKQENANSEE